MTAQAVPTYDWHKLHLALWHRDPDIAKNRAATMAHPARFARLLVKQIYADALARGFVAPGDRVLDPFAGTGLGSFDAMANGLHWYGVEIEPRHRATAAANIENWDLRYRPAMPGWGSAQVALGDSSNLASLLPAEALGQIRLLLTSPPYADVIRQSNDGPGVRHDEQRKAEGSKSWRKKVSEGTYGQAPGQLDALPVGSPEAAAPGTFWGQAAAIVRACHSVMAPEAVAFWNVKDYVRGGAVVEFGQQWQSLCQANGFAPLYQVRSWLVEEKGIQYDLQGQPVAKTIAYKSQPRRLAEKKGAPPIDWEWVIVMQRVD